MSMRLNDRANGMAQYAKKLAKLQRAAEDLVEPMREAGAIGLAAVQSYPPYDGGWRKGVPSFSFYKPGSKYRRTRTLQEGWQGRITKGSKIVVRYSITNRSVAYMKYVMGDSQVGVHAGFWNTLDRWDNLVAPETLKIFQDFMKKASAGL